MGSLPNLHTLAAQPDTRELYSPLQKGTRNSSPVRFAGVQDLVDLSHQPVKHVRSVDCSIYHAVGVDRRIQDHGVVERKHRDHRVYHTLDRKLPVIIPAVSAHRVSQLIHVSNQRITTAEVGQLHFYSSLYSHKTL